MTFDELLSQVQELLQREQRVSYRGLKRRFDLDDEYLEDLKEELIGAKRLATDEDGRFLVWVGEAGERKAKSVERELEERKAKSVKRIGAGQESDVAPRPTLHAQRSDGERRQLTVMFCDLVGSTALSTQLDPEELQEVVRAYQETCAEVIRRYDGYVAQHLGDGLLVYFGYPAAHEDDAARAVRAGLKIVGAIRGQITGDGGQAKRKPLQVRIGIHTGLVVIGEIGSSEKREMLALGETPNIAARIQGQANPDEVVISAATYRLVEGLFECEDRGQPELKGVATPLTLYRVVKEGEAQSRFQVVVRRGLTPLVGRDHEYGLLQERWTRMKEGEGQVVLLSGEPGIGKSRLVEALKETVEHEGARCLELRCSPYHQNSALYPMIEHLQRILQFNYDDSSEQKLEKLEQLLSHSGLDLQETVPLLASLLSLPAPRYTLPAFSPQKQKEKTHEALVAWFCEEAKQQAVIYAWEDLHWADPSTLELLTLFLAQVPTTRLLAVFTYRPEFTPPWGSHSYLSQLTLSRLGRNHVETMIEKVTGGKTLPQEVVQQIVNKTDGVPLFVEEMTKSVVEAIREQVTGDGVQEGKFAGTPHAVPVSLAIPTTLQDSLMARLDRLGTAKEIAQIGATIGREFNYDLLQVVSSLNEQILQQGLKQLVESELVYQSGVPPQARYLFKHALVQDTAYQSFLKSRRQQLHQTIGKVLEEQFPETKEMHPELIAHHYTEAGLIAQAIPYWQQAGQRAAERSANVEAIEHLTKGLVLLETLPHSLERTQQELRLQVALGTPLIATKGYAGPEVGQAYTRARELCQQIGDTAQLFPVLVGLSFFYMVRAEHSVAHELAGQVMRLAQNVQDPTLLLEAHRVRGSTLFWLGEFVAARKYLEQGIALYDLQKYHSHTLLAGQDPGVSCLAYVTGVLWSLGYPDQALKSSRAALTLARELSHPHSQAFALFRAAWLHHFRREMQPAQEQAEAAIALSSEQGFPHWLALATILRGWALAEQGQGEKGIAQMHQGLVTWRTTGSELFRPSFLALLAEAYGKVGRVEEGLTVLAEAQAVMDKTGERNSEAELYRLKGTLRLQSQASLRPVSSKSQASQDQSEDTDPQTLNPDPQGEAEACFLKAIEIARRQQAKSWELRATTSLARLWQQQGKAVEAHKLLSEVYNWFTEGFDTKDLQEAKALIEELSHCAIE